jgi:DNA-binding transcriptional ArsR family regulator
MMNVPYGKDGRNIPRFVSFDLELDPLAHLLFVMIAHEIDLETNSAEISIEELATIMGVSAARVWRHLPALEAKGYIEIERRGKRKTDRHIFHIAGPAAPIVLNQVGPSSG